ncbi:MAG: hypothetical protein R2778_03980 [Saprospiraceae bacterium]
MQFHCRFQSSEHNFKGVVDLVTNQAIVWNEHDQGMTYNVIPIPDDLKEMVNEQRQILIEEVASYDDDTLLKKFFDDPDSITVEEMRATVRATVCDLKMTPVMSVLPSKTKAYRLVWMQLLLPCQLQPTSRLLKVPIQKMTRRFHVSHL